MSNASQAMHKNCKLHVGLADVYLTRHSRDVFSPVRAGLGDLEPSMRSSSPVVVNEWKRCTTLFVDDGTGVSWPLQAMKVIVSIGSKTSSESAASKQSPNMERGARFHGCNTVGRTTSVLYRYF